MPMERAVPATIRSAASRLVASSSGSLVRAISRTWLRHWELVGILQGRPDEESPPGWPTMPGSSPPSATAATTPPDRDPVP